MGKDNRGSGVDRETSSQSQVDEEWTWEAREMGGTTAWDASEATVGVGEKSPKAANSLPIFFCKQGCSSSRNQALPSVSP